MRHHDGPFGDSSAIPTYVVAQADAPARHRRAHRRRRRRALLRLHALPRGRGGRARPGAAAHAGRAHGGAAVPRAPTRAHRCWRARAASSTPQRCRSADRIAGVEHLLRAARAILRADVAARSAPPSTRRSPGSAPCSPRRAARPPWRACSSTTSAPTCPTTSWSRPTAARWRTALETRAPFLDTALIEYAATLPPSYLRRGTRHQARAQARLRRSLARRDPHARQDGLRRAARHLVPRRPARLPPRSLSATARGSIEYLDRAAVGAAARRAPARRARSRPEAVGAADARDLAAPASAARRLRRRA